MHTREPFFQVIIEQTWYKNSVNSGSSRLRPAMNNKDSPAKRVVVGVGKQEATTEMHRLAHILVLSESIIFVKKAAHFKYSFERDLKLNICRVTQYLKCSYI